MVSTSAPLRPARYLLPFLLLLIGSFVLVFFTGDKQAKPKLGIDLQGGTRVTLTARTPDGSKPSRESLDQAKQIISARVDGLGVSGSEVIIDGDNLVITVPGSDSSGARSLGQTARLYIRPVIGRPFPVDALLSHWVAHQASSPRPGRRRHRPGRHRASRRPRGNHPCHRPAPACRRADAGRAAAGAAAAVPRSATTLTGADADTRWQTSPRRRPRTTTRHTGTRNTGAAAGPTQGGGGQDRRGQGAAAEHEPAAAEFAAIELAKSRCEGPDPLLGNDDPNLPLITCGQDHQGRKAIYLLDKSIISGDQIKSAVRV